MQNKAEADPVVKGKVIICDREELHALVELQAGYILISQFFTNQFNFEHVLKIRHLIQHKLLFYLLFFIFTLFIS